MKKVAILFIHLFLLLFRSESQNIRVEQRTHQIIEQRTVELNGGLRASVGGKSRTSIKIDLPANTKEWYYSFTTTAGASGVDNLNLALQLTSLLTEPTGLTAAALKKVKIPKGTSSADIYLCDRGNIDLFNVKADLNGSSYRYIMEGTVENTSQALVKIDDVSRGTWYLGLKNPSTLDAVNVLIEVVAIVEEKKVVPKTAEQEKAELFGNLGWKAYDRGDFDKCLELSGEALKINPDLGWVHNNVGLVKLIKGDYIAAIDSYAKAISLFNKSETPKRWFGEAIKDLNNLISKHGELDGAKDILDNLTSEFNKYQILSKSQ